MEILITTLNFAIYNAVRGAGIIPRVVMCAIAGLFIQYLHNDYVLSLITFFGLWIYFVFGWGKYFIAFSGDMNVYKETEVKPIDWLTDKIVGAPTTKSRARLWGMVGMALRGSLLSIPMFAGFSIYLSSFTPLIGIIAMLLQGVIYWSMQWVKDGKVRKAEIITGGLIGFIISLMFQLVIK